MNELQTQVLFDLLRHVNGASFIAISTDTAPIMNRTIGGRGTPPNPHYGRIIKRQKNSSVMVFQNKTTNGYRNMVRKRLLAEGKDPESFVIEPRRWGTRLPGLPIVEHEGQYYLEVIFLTPGPVEYLLDGRTPIQLQDIIGLRDLPPPEQGGLSRKVQLRVVKFDSIRHISIDGLEMDIA